MRPELILFVIVLLVVGSLLLYLGRVVADMEKRIKEMRRRMEDE